MKNPLLRWFILLLFLAPALCHAEVLLYKGTGKRSYDSEFGVRNTGGKLILVISPQEGSITRIEYNLKGSKQYFVYRFNGFQMTEIARPDGKTFTLFVRAGMGNMGNGFIGDAIFVKGANVPILINTETTVLFPKTFNWSGKGIFPASNPNNSNMFTDTALVSLNRDATILSNSNGDTLDDAVARVSADLESKGYIRFQ